MKFYAYEKSGVLQTEQWDEDEIFEHLRNSGDSAVIFARNTEDLDYLNGMKLMFGIDILICNYAAWSSLCLANGLPQVLPQCRFSLEPIPYH